MGSETPTHVVQGEGRDLTISVGRRPCLMPPCNGSPSRKQSCAFRTNAYRPVFLWHYPGVQLTRARCSRLSAGSPGRESWTQDRYRRGIGAHWATAVAAAAVAFEGHAVAPGDWMSDSMRPSGKSPGRRANWSREQTLLAFQFYCETPFGQLHGRNKRVIELANLSAARRMPSP